MPAGLEDTGGYGLKTGLRLFFKSHYLFSGLNKRHYLAFQVISEPITVLKLSKFRSTEDLPKFLSFIDIFLTLNFTIDFRFLAIKNSGIRHLLKKKRNIIYIYVALFRQ